MHISYENRLLWQIKVTHPLAAIFYNRFTYPWRFTRVPSVSMSISLLKSIEYIYFKAHRGIIVILKLYSIYI